MIPCVVMAGLLPATVFIQGTFMNKLATRTFPFLPLAAAIAAASASAQPAAPADESIDEVVVFGRNTNLMGTAATASEGSIGGADLLIRPMFRAMTGEDWHG